MIPQQPQNPVDTFGANFGDILEPAKLYCDDTLLFPDKNPDGTPTGLFITDLIMLVIKNLFYKIWEYFVTENIEKIY